MLIRESYSPPLLAEEVAQGALQRSVQRSENHHERAIEQGAEGEARCMWNLDDLTPALGVVRQGPGFEAKTNSSTIIGPLNPNPQR